LQHKSHQQAEGYTSQGYTPKAALKRVS